MKNCLKALILLLITYDAVSGYGLNEILDFYSGVDAQVRVMKFKEGFGDNLLHKTLPQGNVYVGIKLNESVALEVGHETTLTRTCESVLTTGECVSGYPIPELLCPAAFKAKSKIKGPHFNLVGFCPLENERIQLIASVGVSALKGTAERHSVSFGYPPVKASTVRTMSKHKTCLRFMTGVQYMTDFGLGIRGTMSLINTRKMVISKDDFHPSVIMPMIKPKDSLVFGLGGFWKF